ncbi:MAG: hypothetical protein CML33_04735 [Rhodobacteraceae bacterium]|nr:hypothetical protein [Paracoccaceae bacterium]
MIELGVLADDLTGGMMVASLLESEGVSCPLVTSVNELAEVARSEATAVVVARKIRLVDAALAEKEAVRVVQALQAIGCKRFFYKYCATFDSTEKGNIGPVADAMLTALSEQHTLFCPAFPRYTVTLLNGILYLGKTPLGESFKRDDPVTPMTNSNLVEVLQMQSQRKVGLISREILGQGPDAIEEYIQADDDTSFYITDAADDEDMARIADFALDWSLTTGADALPVFLARAWQQRDRSIRMTEAKTHLSASPGYEAFIAGSCAAATLSQVAYFEQRHPTFRVDLIEAAKRSDYVDHILSWAADNIASGPIGVTTSVDLEGLKITQSKLGRQGAADLADRILGEVASGLHTLGVRKFVVAGGETSGQIMSALNVKQLAVAGFDELSGGYCHQAGTKPTSFVLKAGAIPKDDFFFIAIDRLREADMLG